MKCIENETTIYPIVEVIHQVIHEVILNFFKLEVTYI